jgi:hypothetical protein
VHLIIRGETLETSMSRYLIDQIERHPRITVRPRTQVTALLGTDELEGAELRDTDRRQTSVLAIRGLFVFVGAQPATGWLAGQLAEDAHGFLLTGSNIPEAQLEDRERAPLFLYSWKPAGAGSSPSAMSAASRSSGPRPRSAKAAWRCGSSSNASRPPGVPPQTRPAPTQTAAMRQFPHLRSHHHDRQRNNRRLARPRIVRTQLGRHGNDGPFGIRPSADCGP